MDRGGRSSPVLVVRTYLRVGNFSLSYVRQSTPLGLSSEELCVKGDELLRMLFQCEFSVRPTIFLSFGLLTHPVNPRDLTGLETPYSPSDLSTYGGDFHTGSIEIRP